MKRKVAALSLKDAPTIHPLAGQSTLSQERLSGLEMWWEGPLVYITYLGIEALVPLSNVKALVLEKEK